jgi:hypothetical protein
MIPYFHSRILRPVACIIRTVGTMYVAVRFIVPYCRCMFRSFYYLQALIQFWFPKIISLTTDPLYS